MKSPYWAVNLNALRELGVKVLFDCSVPFSLAHGGQQVQIEQTMGALQKLGVTVEPLRWWDEHQAGEILHFFGRTPINLLESAKRKGLRVVTSALEGGLGAKPVAYRFLLRVFRRLLRKTTPAISRALAWDSFRLSDASIALTSWEAHLLHVMYGADLQTIYTIPNGVEPVFLENEEVKRDEWLVCTGTICEQKQILKLAMAAVAARTPLRVIGQPYSEADEYFRRFAAFARRNSTAISYEGPVTDRLKLATIYRQARGFVLLSKWESLSLSTLEAAGCGCPLLLSDLPWARAHFKANATFCSHLASIPTMALGLRRFYDSAPLLPRPPKPPSWFDVAQRLKTLYESLVSTSR